MSNSVAKLVSKSAKIVFFFKYIALKFLKTLNKRFINNETKNLFKKFPCTNFKNMNPVKILYLQIYGIHKTLFKYIHSFKSSKSTIEMRYRPCYDKKIIKREVLEMYTKVVRRKI